LDEPAATARSLTEAVLQKVRADILACRLAPGQKLKITDLCQQAGVSLGVVREALSRLAAEGWVVAEAQRGFSVTPVSGEDLRDLSWTRIEVENLALQKSIALGDVAWEGQVVSAFHQLSRIPERDPEDRKRINSRWVDAHTAFHAALVDACDSVWLKRIRANLYAQAERYRSLSVPIRRSERDVSAEHQAIMQAVLMRDSEKACMHMREHLQRTTQILLQSKFVSPVQRSSGRKIGQPT